MDRVFLQYAVNAAWQLPVLAAGAWLLIRTARPAAATQHRIWVAVLALAVTFPFLGVLTNAGAGTHVAVIPATAPSADTATGSAHQQLPVPQTATLGTTGTSWLAKAEASLASLRLTHRIEISAQTAEWITGIYLLVMLLGLIRIARAWSGARYLVQRSRSTEMTSHERALLTECARRMGVQSPKVRIAHHAGALPGPAIVGATRPVLLCPEGFLRQLLDSGRDDEATAALCHEMAHIRRQDYAVNLICEAMAVPLRWHPVTYGVERRIRGTREMACDAMAAQAMKSGADYARCLVGLAEQMTTGRAAQPSGAIGLFHGNALEERVMQLIEKQAIMSKRAKAVRRMAGVTVMAAAVALVTMVHVVPATAQTPDLVTPTSQTRPLAPPPSAKPMKVAASTPQAAPVAKPNPAVLPQAHPSPAPQPKAIPAPVQAQPHQSEIILNGHGKMYAWVDGHKRQLTPAEKARVQKQLEEAQKKVAAAEARIHSPEFKKQIEEAEHQATLAQKQLHNGEIQKQLAEARKKAAEAEARINSPEFKAKIAEAQRQAAAAMAKLNSPEFRKQIAEAQKQALDSARMQKQLAKAQKTISEAMAKLNSQKFKEQMARAQRKAMEAQRKLENGQIQKQLKEAQKKLQQQLDKLKNLQHQSAPSSPDQP